MSKVKIDYIETKRHKERKIKVKHIDSDLQRYADNKKHHRNAIKQCKADIKQARKNIRKHRLLLKQVKIAHKLTRIK